MCLHYVQILKHWLRNPRANPRCLTISIGVPLTAEDAVLFSDVRATQNNVLSSLGVGLAHPATVTETILRAGALPLCQQALRQNVRDRKINGHFGQVLLLKGKNSQSPTVSLLCDI